MSNENVNVATQPTPVSNAPTGSNNVPPMGRLSPDQVIVPPKRQRKEFTDIQGLMESIKQFDVIEPIVVTLASADPLRFTLIAGERRLRACTLLRKTDIPYVLREAMPVLMHKKLELEENLQRANLTPHEEAMAVMEIDQLQRQLVGEAQAGQGGDGWKQEKTAEMIGQSRQSVTNKIKYAKKFQKLEKLDAVTARKIKELPVSVALRKMEQMEVARKVEKQHAAGEVKLNQSLRQGDCRVLIKELPDASVSLYLTDPPFGLDEIEDSRQKGGQGEVSSYAGQLSASDNLTLDAAKDLLRDLAPEVFRVMKEGGHFYIFCSTTLSPFIYETFQKAGFECQQSLVIWDKLRTTTPGRGYEYASCYEPIVFGWKPPRSRMLTSSSSNILRFKPLHSTKKLHPFEKPGKLIRFLIEQSSVLGDLILDTFAGSGRTPLEAKRLNRNCIAFELNPQNFMAAQARLLMPMESEDDEEEENGKKK
jgi:ParB/RepB/Spo0J family partition protein